MRLNRFVAASTSLSRRAADKAIADGRVKINGITASVGDVAAQADTILLDGQQISIPEEHTLILINKPVGYVCSRNGQGSQTIYELLPSEYHNLQTVGRLDKDSSGLILMTDDGEYAQRLAHPSNNKQKVYEVALNNTLQPDDEVKITEGVALEDGISQLGLMSMDKTRTHWQITMHEGRNRQIRRTFDALNYSVTNLHRTQFGPYKLGNLISGEYEPTEFK